MRERTCEAAREQRTVYLGRAAEALRRHEAVPDALLAHLAPLGSQHVNVTGDYLWGSDDGVGPDGLRPLRGVATDSKQALAACWRSRSASCAFAPVL
jgi:hypothetical protein